MGEGSNEGSSPSFPVRMKEAPAMSSRGSILPGVMGICLVLAALASGCGDGGEQGGKVVVIGLDGATWEILQPWIDRGDLPTLAGLQECCAWGELQSAVPYLSPPAWTTAVTGVNPGKHAIFDFQRRLPGQAAVVNETAKSRRAQPVWNILNASGKRVLLMNIPMTDPPDPIDGLFIAGFPHLNHTGFTHPPELEDRLGDYVLDELQIKLFPGKEDSLLAAYHRDVASRKRIMLEWLADEPFDMMWVVFTATDRIQHTFWIFMDPENPNYDAEKAEHYGEAIHDLWVAVDRALGEILTAIGPEATTLVMSDHGFGPMRYDLRLQNFLRSSASGFTEQEANGIYVLDPGDASRIYIARRGRDPGAVWSPAEALSVRRKLVAALKAAVDPRTGRKICEAVWVNEGLFAGTYAEKGPDVVVLPSYGYFLTFGEIEPSDESPVIAPHTDKVSAWHRMNGIYAIRGTRIRPGRRDGDGGDLYSLVDIVPTVLYLMGQPVPDGLDGDVMRDLFDQSYLRDNPPQSCGPLEEDYRELTPEEIENLKNLPYIGG